MRDEKTILAIRLSRKNKRTAVELIQAFLILAFIAFFAGFFWAMESYIEVLP